MGESRSYSVHGFESFSGTGANDDDVLFTAPDIRAYGTFLLMSSAGAPLSLTDMGAELLTPVLVTVAGRVYGFRGKFRGVRVLQNGLTAATACLTCGNNL
jgi:hypothetical protein